MTDPITRSENGGDDSTRQDVALKPNIRPRREGGISWIWLVPLLAALLGASLLVRDWMHTGPTIRSEEHTSELQSLMRISYAVFCLKKKKNNHHSKQAQQI